MSTPITPLDLFREFSAMEDSAEIGARMVYGTAVDLVDGMLKGATMDQWADIYSHIRKAASDNQAKYAVRGEQDEAEAWAEVVQVLDLAIESVADCA